MSKGSFIVAAWGGFLATLTFWVLSDFTLARAEVWCIDQEADCVRQWVGALSGWAAAAAALITFGVLFEQLQHARATSQHDLRAYMAMIEARLVNVDGRAEARVTIKNLGKTFANNVRTYAGWHDADAREDPHSGLQFSIDERPSNLIGSVAPGQTDDYYFPANDVTEHQDVIRHGAMQPILSIEVLYDDAFGLPHKLAFALRTYLVDSWEDHEMSLVPPGYHSD